MKKKERKKLKEKLTMSRAIKKRARANAIAMKVSWNPLGYSTSEVWPSSLVFVSLASVLVSTLKAGSGSAVTSFAMTGAACALSRPGEVDMVVV
jgi:hypothetical protein